MLYGSHSSNDVTNASDYDLAGFCDIAESRRIAGPWRDSYLDVFLYPLAKLQQPGPELLHLRNGRVLFDTPDNAAEVLLAAIDEIFGHGPKKLPPDEALARRQWAWKMLDRARSGDPEGNFRRAWLLTALLEDHFQLSGRWYLGPKKSLAHLKMHEPHIYGLFTAALAPGARLSSIENLVRSVSGGRKQDEAERGLYSTMDAIVDV